MHASGWEVLDPVMEVFSLPIEPAIKKGRVISHTLHDELAACFHYSVS
jgi:hypothetical protein